MDSLPAGAGALLCVAAWAAIGPRRSLLPAALVLTATIPFDYGLTSAFGRQFPLALPMIVVWAVRTRQVPVDGRAVLLVGAAAFSVAISALLSAAPVSASLDGAVVLVILGSLALRAGSLGSEVQGLVRTWKWLGPAVAAVCMYEVVAGELLLATWWSQGETPLVQHWATLRATATVGHPLMAGAFLAASAGIWLARGRVGPSSLLALAVLVGGIWATGSRSAVVALVVAMLWTVGTRSRSAVTRLLGFASTAVLLGLVLTGRIQSLYALVSRGQEGRSSIESRPMVLEAAWSVFRENTLFGVGPGQASITVAQAHPWLNVPVESAPLELLTAWGVFGTVAVTGLVLTIAAQGTRTLAIRFTPLLALIVASGFFNMFEGHSKALILLGLAAACARDDRPVVRESEVTSNAHRPGHPEPARRRR